MVKIEINISIPKRNSGPKTMIPPTTYKSFSISSNSQEFTFSWFFVPSPASTQTVYFTSCQLNLEPSVSRIIINFHKKWHSPWTFLSWIETYWWSKPSDDWQENEWRDRNPLHIISAFYWPHSILSFFQDLNTNSLFSCLSVWS